MKKGILLMLTGAAIYFSACQKDESTPKPVSSSTTSTTATTTKSTSSVTTASQTSQPNDTTQGYLSVILANPAVATQTDQIILQFTPSSSAAFVAGEDARTFATNSAVSLSSLSSNGILLAINAQPLVSTGTTIPLAVNAAKTGLYKLNLTAVNDIPSNIDIWLMDKTEKDSLDFRLYPSYSFDINTSDTTTYGKNRFAVVLRAH